MYLAKNSKEISTLEFRLDLSKILFIELQYTTEFINIFGFEHVAIVIEIVIGAQINKYLVANIWNSIEIQESHSINGTHERKQNTIHWARVQSIVCEWNAILIIIKFLILLAINVRTSQNEKDMQEVPVAASEKMRE